MRNEQAGSREFGGSAGGLCGGLLISLAAGVPQVRRLPGDFSLREGVAEAVLQGLHEAPALLAEALRLAPGLGAFEQIEVQLVPGAQVQGEATRLGQGRIRLQLGESAPPEEARRIARHEALHLLLACSLRGGEKWAQPELAFAEWIVRGLEAGGQAPSIAGSLLLSDLPRSRLGVKLDGGAAVLGEPLAAALERTEGEQQRRWLVEAALGAHFLAAAAGRFRAVLLDDWLLDYEQYARALGNAPLGAGKSGAGNLWQLHEAGWSSDPLTRLAVAAQALQAEDACAFADGAEPPVLRVWKSRGRIRVPLLAPEPTARPFPLQTFRASAPQEVRALVEQATRSGAHLFEALALWPRILARLFAARLAAPDLPDPLPGEPPFALPCVQPVEEAAQAVWESAARRLRELVPDCAAWVPRVLPAQPEATLLEAPRGPATLLLVCSGECDPAALRFARTLASQRAVRGALFADLLGGSAAEALPDLPDPLDPRYRESTWREAPLPETLDELPAIIDEATRTGTPLTPLAHLLAMMGPGLEEWVY